jgi:uncharacterized membrane protein
MKGKSRPAPRSPSHTSAIHLHAARTPAAATPTGKLRVHGIDALRGGAIVLMIVYHFCFDLRYFHVTAANFEHDPFWLGFRALIVTCFMTLVGVSLVLAHEARISSVRRWRRVAVIAACALAASAASYVMFPRTFIYFGILHCIAVASVLAWPLVRFPVPALIAGLAIVVAGLVYSNAAFDAPWLSWIGFTTRKPATEDYVPLAPWLGVVLIGIALGHALARSSYRALRPLAGAPSWLRLMGRHSLAVYMIHQPILMTVLWLFVGR